MQGTRQKLLEDGVDFKENMAKLGIDPTSFTEHSPALNAQIPGLVSGSVRAVHNGQAEGSNGVDVYPRSTLDAPITKPVTYNTYDGAVDKEGVPVPTQHVLQPDGKITANDYLDRYFAGQAQLTRQAQQISARMTMEQHKAAIKESNAKAFQAGAAGELSEAQAKNMRDSGINLPEGYQRPANAPVMSQPELESSLRAQGVQVPNDFPELYAIAHYKGDLNKDYPARISPRSGQKSASQAVTQIRTLIDPNFNGGIL